MTYTEDTFLFNDGDAVNIHNRLEAFRNHITHDFRARADETGGVEPETEPIVTVTVASGSDDVGELRLHPATVALELGQTTHVFQMDPRRADHDTACHIADNVHYDAPHHLPTIFNMPSFSEAYQD